MDKPAIYLALLHHPILNRVGEVVATAVTNVDVHDISRSSRTYGVNGVFFVTPIAAQLALVRDIVEHWTDGEGARRNPIRADAFRIAHAIASWTEAADWIRRAEGQSPEVVVTSARQGAGTTGFGAYRRALRQPGCPPQLLLFGTGWGLADDVMSAADRRLAPVRASRWAASPPDSEGLDSEEPKSEGRGEYNHLSVRSAVATILDRVFGDGLDEWND